MKSWGKRRKANLASTEPQAQSQTTSFGKSLRRKKTEVLEVKPELDLATALPDTSDFRTSLMMPVFSARFSMLREADEPDTKIGKASDDSVLFPKRASRMNLFSHNPLTDIAEVESIRGSTLRPPLTDNSRSHSFVDGYASDDGGNIMSRSKPGEGNNLFGGRQKLYRIPATADGDGEGPHLGRHMYESDVSMSMFQQLRLKERMERASEDTNERPSSLQQTDTEDADTVNSPSTGFSKNRGTTSSTTSAPSNRRTSTAATSIASESPALPPGHSTTSMGGRASDQSSAVERTSTLHKRMYGGNLDQLSPNRKTYREGHEIAPRARATSSARLANRLSISRSATNLGEKYTRQHQVFASSTFRAASPPPSGAYPSFPAIDSGLRDWKRSGSPADACNNVTSPVSEDEDVATYTQHVQPSDRGKATAMGLFNRPQRRYDEQQFSQRQLQMAEGRNSPAPVHENSSRADSRDSKTYEQLSSSIGRNSSSDALNSQMTGTRASPVPSNGRGSPLVERASPTSIPPTSRPRTKSSASVAAAATVKARAEELIRRQNAELSALEAQRFGSNQPASKVENQHTSSTQSVSIGTFLDTLDASDDDDEVDSPHQNTLQTKTRRDPSGIHPALRNGTLDFDFGNAVSNQVTSNETSLHESNNSLTALPKQSYDPNETLTSNTYGQNTSAATNSTPGLSLAGMISHIRDHSAGSSIYPPQSPVPPSSPHLSRGTPTEIPRTASVASTTRTWNEAEASHSDPWELDSFGSQHQEMKPDSTPYDPNKQMAKKAQRMLGLATAPKDRSKAQQILGNEAPNAEDHSQWQEDGRSMHHRDVSSGTQRERDAFESELAERRQKVKENLRTAVDSGSRSPSPATRRSPSMSSNPFAALKHKSSKTSLSNKSADHTSSTKAMKMLGISGPMPTDRSSPRHTQQNAWQEEEERMLRHFGRRRKQSSAEDSFGKYRQSPPREHSTSRYGDQSTSRSGRSTPYEQREQTRQRSATPNTGRSSESRSESAASGRSKSRQGRYPDRPEPAMPGAVLTTSMNELRSPTMGGPFRRPQGSESPLDHPEFGGSALAMSNGQHSNDRPAMSEQREGLRRGPSLKTATMPSGQPMLSPRPVLSPDESMPTPREILGEFSHDSPEDQPVIARQSSSDEAMHPPRRAPMHTASNGYSRTHSSPPRRDEYSTSLSGHPSPRMAPGSQFGNGRTTPTTNGRTTPNIGGRKKSISKNMISDPTFLSSTSSIPLVTLPSGQTIEHHGPVPMLPVQNPRRRGNTTTQTVFGGFSKTHSHDISPPFPRSISESPHRMYHLHNAEYTYRSAANEQKKSRNRLRKTSSEGGSMGVKAARQAMHMDHLASPEMPTFPNKSATHLGREGGMF